MKAKRNLKLAQRLALFGVKTTGTDQDIVELIMGLKQKIADVEDCIRNKSFPADCAEKVNDALNGNII